MKESIETIKRLWQNPRYKSLIKLGFWLVFFSIVILMIRGANQMSNYSNNSDISTQSDKVKDLANYQNYEFTITITDSNNLITKLVGTYYQNKHYFTCNDKTYYYDGKTLYEVDELNHNLVKIDIVPWQLILYVWDHTIIDDYISQAIPDSETTYNDGNTVNKYHYDTESDILFVKDISTNKSNGIINRIEMNIQQDTLYNVIIDYQHINNIASFNIDYSNFNIIEKSD